MRGRTRGLIAIGLVASLSASASTQDAGSVKVTAARANVRAEAMDTAPVLTQVTLGTMLTLVGVEGDWFHVRLPPHPRLGGVRVDAYISKKVATMASAPATPAAPEPSVPAASAATASNAVDGMSVALNSAGTTGWVASHAAQLRHVATRLDSLRSLAVALAPADADGRDVQTWAWTLAGSSSERVLDGARPTFVVVFKNVPGVNAEDLAPMIVRASPTSSGGRLIAATRGTIDLSSRTAANWDPSKDLKQDVVRSDMRTLEPGTVTLTPSADLPSGQYAVVLRPAGNQKLSGATILSSSAEGRVLGLAWDFAIK